MGETALLRPPSRRELRNRLKRLRREAGISAAKAAARINVSQTTLTRIESGEIEYVKPVYVEVLCAFYGATPEETARLLEIANAARGGARSWWEQYGNDGPPKWFSTYIGLEDEATSIQEFALVVVPGLLQTEEYAREVLSLGPLAGNPAEIEKQVEIRMQRQAILDREEERRPQLRAVLDESVLLRELGGRATMRRQLDELLVASDRANVAVQVLPFSAGGHAGMDGGPFIVLDFVDPADEGAVYSDQHAGALILEEVADVQRHRSILERLQASVLDAEESRKRIRRVAEGL